VSEEQRDYSAAAERLVREGAAGELVGDAATIRDATFADVNRPRDPQTGQFVSSGAEPLTGRAGLEDEAGYREMPVHPYEREELRRAAELQKVEPRTETPENLKTIERTVEARENETLDAKRAAHALAETRRNDAALIENALVEQAGKQLGIEQPQPAQPQLEQPPPPADPMQEAREAIEKNPVLRDYLTRATAEVEQRAAQYQAAIDLAVPTTLHRIAARERGSPARWL
jgi:hypothetical protein